MKKIIYSFLFLLFPSTIAFADNISIYDSYDAYYTTYPNSIFKEADQLDFETEGQYVSIWNGIVKNKHHSVEIKNNSLNIDGYHIHLKSATTFPGEKVDDGIGLAGDRLFFSNSYACIEALYPSASGTSSRHKSVYLIDLIHLKAKNKKQNKVFLLPSLFGTCMGLRLNEFKKVAFYQVTYRYDSMHSAIGIVFDEYYIDENNFILSGNKTIGRFSETENVYKFYIE